jgi:hypothetical protein
MATVVARTRTVAQVVTALLEHVMPLRFLPSRPLLLPSLVPRVPRHPQLSKCRKTLVAATLKALRVATIVSALSGETVARSK